MNLHKNACLTPQVGALLVQRVRTDGWGRGMQPPPVLLNDARSFGWRASGTRRTCPRGPQFGGRPIQSPHET